MAANSCDDENSLGRPNSDSGQLGDDNHAMILSATNCSVTDESDGTLLDPGLSNEDMSGAESLGCDNPVIVSELDEGQKQLNFSDVEQRNHTTDTEERPTSVTEFEDTRDVICSTSQDQRRTRTSRDDDLRDYTRGFMGHEGGDIASSVGNGCSLRIQSIEVEGYVEPLSSRSR